MTKAVFKKLTFRTKVGLLSHLPGMHYLEIPKAVVEKLGGKFNVRLLCRVNGEKPFRCGIVALGKGAGYISFAKTRMKESGAGLDSRVEVELRPDKSEFGMEMPDELREVLGFDPEGQRRFDQLTPGRQRYVIGHVAAVKSEEKRIERALNLITNLKKLPVGNESFREMLGLPPRENTPSVKTTLRKKN